MCGLDPLSRRLRHHYDPAMLDELRTADLATTAPSGEIAVVLPNTSSETARVVVERLASAFPEAEINEASYETGDTPETLVERARQTQRG